jgi:hypothetical protein
MYSHRKKKRKIGLVALPLLYPHLKFHSKKWLILGSKWQADVFKLSNSSPTPI